MTSDGVTRALVVVAMTAVAARALAFGGGVSGRSGAPGAGSCSDCHSGAASPTVTLFGPTSIPVGRASFFRLDIVTGASTREGSWDVAVIGDAVLDTVGGPPEAQILNGELTHTSTRAAGATVSVSFTLRPSTPGTITLYANGLSSDGSGTGGDGVGAAQLAIAVEPPADLAGVDLTGFDLAEPAPELPDLAGAPDLAKPPPRDEPQWACACDVGGSAPSPPGAALFVATALLLSLSRRRFR